MSAAMKMTKGEFRGAVALGAVLAIILAVTAVMRFCSAGGSGSEVYATPDSVAARGAAHPDSATVAQEGMAPAQTAGKPTFRSKKHKKEARTDDVRPSPHDDVNSD